MKYSITDRIDQKYTNKTNNMASSSNQTFVKPLFVKDSDVGKVGDSSISPYDMCKAVTRVTSESKLEGVQKVNNLWRIYLKDATTRLELITDVKQIWINGRQVTLYDQNPYFSRQEMLGDPSSAPQNNDKITIKHLPLSVSNESIKNILEEQGVKLMSPHHIQ